MAASAIAVQHTGWGSPQRVLLGIAGVALLIQAALVALMPVNWDEFRFLAEVHQLARGELAAPLQTFHAHLFLWLTWLPLDEIGQIIVGRSVMLVLECATAALIYRCAREFAQAPAAAFALTCYLTLTFVMRHGASFRYDPLSTLLLMSAVALVLTTSRRAALAMAGAAVALAAMITIKSAFYIPTLAVLAWSRWRIADNRARYLAALGVGALSGVAALAAFYIFHQTSLAPVVDGAADIVSGGVDKTIAQSQLFPRADVLERSLFESPFYWIVLLVGVGGAIAQLIAARTPAERAKLVALLAMALPVVTLAFYRNAFPYYFGFMLAPASVLCAVAAPMVSRLVRLEFAGVAMLVLAAVNAASQPFAILDHQRSVVGAVHALFPPGTPYIDRSSMIASSRKHGIFMSSWGIEAYRDAGRAIYRDILLNAQPVYLLANGPMLESALAGGGGGPHLLAADAAVLRNNFVHHWGPVWVAGKTIAAGERQFELFVPGHYTLEASAPVAIDGVVYRPGQIMQLPSGEHVARASSEATLRWGDRLPVPPMPSPPGPLFGDL